MKEYAHVTFMEPRWVLLWLLPPHFAYELLGLWSVQSTSESCFSPRFLFCFISLASITVKCFSACVWEELIPFTNLLKEDLHKISLLKGNGDPLNLGWHWSSCWDKKDEVSSVARSSWTLLPDKLKLGWCRVYKDACIRPSLRKKPYFNWDWLRRPLKYRCLLWQLLLPSWEPLMLIHG